MGCVRNFMLCVPWANMSLRKSKVYNTRADPEGGPRGPDPPFFLQPFKPKQKKPKKQAKTLTIS